MRILFPTDFSEAADHAFIYALKFAHRIQGDITTVHVYDVPLVRGAHLPNTMKQVYDSITLEQFENYKHHIPHLRDIAAKNNMSHIRVNHSMVEISKHGIVQTIVNVGKEAKADFIIMGTTGASGLKEVFLGSNAADVLQNSTMPVLAVPAKVEFDGRIDKIAFATEYSAEDGIALKTTIKFAQMLNARVFCVHVDTGHHKAQIKKQEKFMMDFDSHENLEWEVVKHNSILDGLATFVDSAGIDILALYIRKRSFIDKLFKQSLTKKMTNHLKVPVLGLHK